MRSLPDFSVSFFPFSERLLLFVPNQAFGTEADEISASRFQKGFPHQTVILRIRYCSKARCIDFSCGLLGT